jgi:hypothetical protein
MDRLTSTLKLLIAALEQLRIPYLVGGSLASSARGIPRATMDVDIVAAITDRQTQQLSDTLGKQWYADPDMMRSSIAAGRSFNLIHMPSSEKIDIFPVTNEFGETQLARATRTTLPGLSESIVCPVASAEDILLAKLQWYRAGGEISDRQWSDIAGIISTNPNLDRAYLDSWARRLGVTDLLARAVAQVEREAKE